MAGLGQRFSKQGYTDPKPFIQIHGATVIEHLIHQFPKHWKLFFVVNENLESKYIQQLPSTVIKTSYSERGPLDTVLASLPHLEKDQPTLVSYCDFSLRWDPRDFEKAVSNVDAAVVGYTGFQPTFLGPNTYCHYLVEGQWVKELQEKKLYTGKLETEWTSCGLYYFKSAKFLEECLAEQLRQNLNYAEKDFYISLALQAMLNTSSKLSVLNYPIKTFIQFGTPFDIERVQDQGHL